MDKEENIYLLIEVPVLGELGPGSDISREKVCEDCGRLEVKYNKIEFVFDRWNGEDLIGAYGIYFVSERLKDAYEKAGMSGTQFTAVSNGKAENFKISSKAYSEALPTFYHITIVGTAKGPDYWYNKIRTCETCGDDKWWPTPNGLRSGNGPSMTGTGKDEINPLPRRVNKDSWKGDDIFFLEDPDPHPIVTIRFRNLCLDLGNDKLFFRETDWV